MLYFPPAQEKTNDNEIGLMSRRWYGLLKCFLKSVNYILSDYSPSTISPTFSLSNKQHCPLFIDPSLHPGFFNELHAAAKEFYYMHFPMLLAGIV